MFDEFNSFYDGNVILHYTGTVIWLVPGLLKSSCLINMVYFPFDTQNCDLRFGSWSYSKEKLSLSHRNPTNELVGNGQTGNIIVDPAFHYNSTEWEIVSTEGRDFESLFVILNNQIHF